MPNKIEAGDKKKGKGKFGIAEGPVRTAADRESSFICIFTCSSHFCADPGENHGGEEMLSCALARQQGGEINK